MNKGTGILLNANGDVSVDVIRDSNGLIAQDIEIGDTTQQNISLILQIQPGELKEYPTMGVGIDNMILDKDYLQYKHTIREQLGLDGIQIDALEITKQAVNINAKYK